MQLPSTVDVLQRDPDLAAELDPDALPLASQSAIARLLRAPRGPWVPGPDASQGRDGLGLLVIEGLLVRRVTVAGRSFAEFLGSGDLLQPWTRDEPPDSVQTVVNWHAVQGTELAVLDRRFARRVAAWPEILTALARRATVRADSLSYQLAVCRLRRVEDRLLLTLWHVADRWGTVTPRGVEIRLPLTHTLLAAVIGVHRPSVTIAARRLADAGLIEPKRGSGWLVQGSPMAGLKTLPTDLSGLRELLDAELPATVAA